MVDYDNQISICLDQITCQQSR